MPVSLISHTTTSSSGVLVDQPSSGQGQPTPPPGERRGAAPSRETRRYDVLVVDDDPILRRSIAETLQESGYRVIGARDGVDALRVLSGTAPWLILLDIYLPVMNGADFVRELRQRGITTRIVVITASRDASAWAERLEAADFLRKPFEMVDVLQAVERYRPDAPTS